MSFGKMNCSIMIIRPERKKDSAGFGHTEKRVLAAVRAYREDRHGTESWANRAAFSTATTLFRFRRIPNLQIDSTMVIVCGDGHYNILSVENVKGRGMYYEVLADKISPTIR